MFKTPRVHGVDDRTPQYLTVYDELGVNSVLHVHLIRLPRRQLPRRGKCLQRKREASCLRQKDDDRSSVLVELIRQGFARVMVESVVVVAAVAAVAAVLV